MSASPRKPSPTPAPPAAGSRTAEGVAGVPTHRPISKIRDNVDALIVAFLLAMFIRMFVVELFMIPSPSMTPTLLGTESNQSAVGFFPVGAPGRDVNDSGVKDMVLWSARYPNRFDVYLRDGNRYYYDGVRAKGNTSDSDLDHWHRSVSVYQDRILVGKFLYWFTPPRRGDIIVFKVPPVIYERDKPIYIKRAAGLPGETLTFEPVDAVPGHPNGLPGHENNMGHLVANGQRVTSPAFFARQLYECRGIEHLPPAKSRPDCVTYADRGMLTDILEVRVPLDGVFAMGDNTVSSADSRYWGAVPLDRLRGRAIFRYNPHYFPFTKDPGFLN
jgi:signal peptidase I